MKTNCGTSHGAVSSNVNTLVRLQLCHLQNSRTLALNILRTFQAFQPLHEPPLPPAHCTAAAAGPVAPQAMIERLSSMRPAIRSRSRWPCSNSNR